MFQKLLLTFDLRAEMLLNINYFRQTKYFFAVDAMRTEKKDAKLFNITMTNSIKGMPTG